MRKSKGQFVGRSSAAFLVVALLTIAIATSYMCVSAASAATVGHKVSYVVTSGPKPYVAVANANGYSPYLIYGVHLRLDVAYHPGVKWKTDKKDCADYYFDRAKYLGFHTVVVGEYWRWIDDGVSSPHYHFDTVQNIIDSAQKRGLSVQLIWNGSDSCGYSSAPQYIDSDHVKYPRNAAHAEFADLSNPRLVQTESAALVAMMNYIAAHDPTHRILGIDIESEADGCGPVESQLKWGNASNMAGLMYAGGQFNAVNALINTLAVAVHHSRWHGITRCNLGTSYRSVDCANYRASLPDGIDMFGIDLYSGKLEDNHNTLAVLDPPSLYSQLKNKPAIDPLASVSYGTRSKFTRNVAYQPEGGGQWTKLTGLILQNFSDGGGSFIYEIRTTQSWKIAGVWQPDYDLGLFRRTDTDDDHASIWQERDGTLPAAPYYKGGRSLGNENQTAQIIKLNHAIYKMDQKIAFATPSSCAGFNLDTSLGKSGATQTETVGSVPVTYKSWSNSPALALRDSNGDLILMNVDAGNDFIIDPSFHHGKVASIGYFDTKNVWHQQYTRPFDGNKITMSSEEVARIVQQR